MPKKNLSKFVTDMIYEGFDEWWSLEKISAKIIDMTYEDFMNEDELLENARNNICEHTKTFIPHVHTAFDEKGVILLSEMKPLDNRIGLERCYKRAVEGDEADVRKKMRKEYRTKNRAKERYDKRLGNAKKQGLLPKDKKIELD